jgi:hypothetical protein
MNGLKNIMKALKKMVNNEEIQKYMAYIFSNHKLYYDTKVCIINFEDFCVYILYNYHNIPIVDYLGI